MFIGSGPFDSMSNHFCLCLAAVAVAIIALITVHRWYQTEYLPSLKHKEGAIGVRGASPYSGFNDLTSKGIRFQTPTDYMSLNEGRNDRSLLNRGQLANYMNLAYPPGDTHFVNAGGQQCAVSGSNNCPSDLYWKCANRKWSKDAIGEALALSAVGSYYVPSAVEDESLHKIVSLAHDPVTHACRDAGNVTVWAPSGSSPPASPRTAAAVAAAPVVVAHA